MDLENQLKLHVSQICSDYQISENVHFHAVKVCIRKYISWYSRKSTQFHFQRCVRNSLSRHNLWISALFLQIALPVREIIVVCVHALIVIQVLNFLITKTP